MNKRVQHKEIENHQKHLALTFEKIIGVLKIDEIIDTSDLSPAFLEQAVEDRVRWIKTSDLVVEGVTTETMVLHHLLWLQSISRIIIDDDDPFCGAVRIRVNLKDLLETKKSIKGKIIC